MKPPKFEYVRATTVADALDALADDPESRLLAGGQSLVPLMNFRLARPSTLIDINAVAELDQLTVTGAGGLLLGALTRHRTLETAPDILARAPLLAEAASLIGHVAIRNRGTLGGAIAHADPAAELPAALMALGAQVVVRGPGGERRASADDLFAGWFSTTLAADEMVTGVEVPARPGSGSAFVEISPRPGDYAIVGVAAIVTCHDDGDCESARITACGVGERPIELTAAAEPLLGQPSLDRTAREIASRASRLVDPVGDVHASVEDRRELVQLLTVRALRIALSRVGAPGSHEEVRS